ncbi:Neural cell adhesion molecule L1 [Larimichthys crocea]|uniref:Neural cell adhesion molecule L1 n=1 Tax=Larimichthys crocea TaxID=215358 RepID=A0A6G0IQ28_LARCR|nr:Neural cell adhesion molecule L1 [Larimichthys crocea]
MESRSPPSLVAALERGDQQEGVDLISRREWRKKREKTSRTKDIQGEAEASHLLCTSPSHASIHIPSNLKRPPMITTQPESVTVFSVEDLVMSCEASGNPSPIFRWTKDGEEFDPASDPELKVTENSGSSAFYTLTVSNEAILTTDALPSQQKEKKVSVKAEEGSSFILKCNPPQSSMKPAIHWMDWRLHHIQLSERVVVGKDGNLYFAHLTTEDSRDDYTCNVQYLVTRTILAKEPISLTVNPSNSVLRNRKAPHDETHRKPEHLPCFKGPDHRA